MDFFQPLVSFDLPSGEKGDKWLLGVAEAWGCESCSVVLGIFSRFCRFFTDVAFSR